MIVGSGMMATAFREMEQRRDIIVFASGVSNSLETRTAIFEREKELLLRTRHAKPEATFLYFGTCSAEDDELRDSPYVRHKLEMEACLSAAQGDWLVLRLPLAIGPGHRGTTLAKMLHQWISQSEHFEVWRNATRYPIDVDDVVLVARAMLSQPHMLNRRVNVATRPYTVLDFVRVMERILNKNANYSIVDRGRHMKIDCPELSALLPALKLHFGDDYLEKVLYKHFAKPLEIGSSG